MRKLVFLLWLWLPAQLAWCQKTPTYQQLARLVAPGVVFVQDSLFMDVAEVNNIGWLEYLHFLRKDSTAAQYRAALPDTMLWRQQLGIDDIYLDYYLRFPGFRFYPVVGISYEQAAAYCRWRTGKVYEITHAKEYLQKNPKLKHYNFRVVYRLPTVREWELAAAGGLDPVQYPFGGVYPPTPGTRYYKQQLQTPAAAACLPAAEAGSVLFSMRFNVRERSYRGSPKRAFNCPDLPNFRLNADGTLTDDSVLTEYVYEYPPNDYGLYCMIGNVAEITATPGIAKGGSFEHSTNDFTLLTDFPYTEPQEWLGFRCAATVYISPKP